LVVAVVGCEEVEAGAASPELLEPLGGALGCGSACKQQVRLWTKRRKRARLTWWTLAGGGLILLL
jgi:hypothetical protein